MAHPDDLLQPVGPEAPAIPESDYARLHWQHRAFLPMWVVYRPGTSDYPGQWVARMHLALPRSMPTRLLLVRDSLDAIRDALPPFLSRLARNADDDPQIEEVWL